MRTGQETDLTVFVEGVIKMNKRIDKTSIGMS